MALRPTVLPAGGGVDGNGPVFVPEGCVVAYHVYAMHRRSDLWGKDAAEFKPERWASRYMTSKISVRSALSLSMLTVFFLPLLSDLHAP